MPRFSIVIPFYNSKTYLERCVESATTQRFDDLEVLLVDDGSTDGSGSVARHLARSDPRVRVFHHPQNRGVSDARNTGMRAARGDYILFLDSDDTLVDDCLGAIADKLADRPSVDVAIGKFRCAPVSGGDAATDHAFDPDIIDHGSPDEVIAHIGGFPGLLGVCWRFIVRREFLSDQALFFMRARIYEDQDFIARLLCTAESFLLYEQPFYCYRTRPSSLSHASDPEAEVSGLLVASSLARFAVESELSASKRRFLESRIEYALGLFTPRMLLYDDGQLRTLAKNLGEELQSLGNLRPAGRYAELCMLLNGWSGFEGLRRYRDRIRERIIGNSKTRDGGDLYLFCAGLFSNAALRVLEAHGREVAAILDNNPAFELREQAGIPIRRPESLADGSPWQRKVLRVLVCNQRESVYREISEQLIRLGLEPSSIAWQVF